jgi:hypothetical protein
VSPSHREDDVSRRRILPVTEPPPPGASPAFIAGWERRQRANLTGRCDCGAQVQMPNRAERRAAAARGEPAHARWLHEDGCPASDQALAALWRASMS